MDMARLQLYKNKYNYPDYMATLTAYGSSMPCTPVGLDLKSGTLRVKGNTTDFMSCNYLALTRDNQTIYAWIENVKFRTEDSFEITYKVDAWRTYRSKVKLGTQFVARHSSPTTQKDDLLGATDTTPDIKVERLYNTNETRRVFVVQVRPSPSEVATSTPVQPQPYQFYVLSYNIFNWKANAALTSLMSALMASAKPDNIVTMYSIPYMDTSSLPTQKLFVRSGSNNIEINGFKFLGDTTDVASLLSCDYPIYFSENISELMKVDHSVQIVIPDAGIMSIPDELLKKPNLHLRQDIDLFSGASNYMLGSGTGDNKEYYHLSVRGGTVSSIPVLSDPLETYLSQNQNALMTSLIGDVASIAGGAGVAVATPGVGAMVGGSTVASGVNGIINKISTMNDVKNQYSNPPAFLGTALANNFNSSMWLVIVKKRVDNKQLVNDNFGYPINKIMGLTFPSSGYVKTEGCNVSSTDGSVPRWALEEINGMFNNGVLVQST